MTISLLNFGMLLGLVGIAVPILVHLLNRRRFDVVEWGAMQFLELGERTRQRIKLSDWLLLLLRIALVLILVFAFARPFLKGSTWIRSLYPEPIDLVIIIDGSYSMGWSEEALTPHARAIQVCHEVLDDLTSVDRVAIIDARERPLLLTPAPLTDASNARLELDRIQRPDGSANLVTGLTRACQLLTQSFSTRREILLLTDQQATSWKQNDQAAWNDMPRIRQAAAVPIEITTVDVGPANMEAAEHFQVERLQLSRELVVTDTPVTITTRVKYSGPLEQTTCQLFWSLDGQQLSRESRTLELRRNEEVTQSFSTRFADPGSHIVAASVTDDFLPGDNLSQAVIQVVPSIPALIVTDPLPSNVPGEPSPPSSTRTANYFLRRAFGDPDRGKVWVTTRSLAPADLNDAALIEPRIVFLTGPLPPQFDYAPLTSFLIRGGAVVVLPEQSTRADWTLPGLAWRIGSQPVLPFATLAARREAIADMPDRISRNSFSAEWLNVFQQESDSDLTDLIITEFWPLEPHNPADIARSETTPPDNDREQNGSADSQAALSPVTVDVRLESGGPLFARRYVGRGQVLQSAIAFDGVGNDLIRLRSFVPLVHELVFGLTRTTSNRNVDLGQPLTLQQLPCQPLKLAVTGPDESRLLAQRSGTGEQIVWTLPAPQLSGLYRFETDCPVPSGARAMLTTESSIPFAVHASREESRLARLTAEEVNALSENYRIRWKANSSAILASLASSSAGIEIWPLLLFLVTGFLVVELLLTRKLVQGGHAQPVDYSRGSATESSVAPEVSP